MRPPMSISHALHWTFQVCSQRSFSLRGLPYFLERTHNSPLHRETLDFQTVCPRLFLSLCPGPAVELQFLSIGHQTPGKCMSLASCMITTASNRGRRRREEVMEGNKDGNGTNRDVVSWTGMIASLARQGRGEEAFEFLKQMQQHGVKPNEITFLGILKAMVSPASLDRGKQVHAEIMKAGFDSDVRVGTALVSMYCKCGSVVDARRVFCKMPKRDVISWNVMIAGAAQLGHGDEAWNLFLQLQREGMVADRITFIGILKACVSQVALEQGKQLHAAIVRRGFESDVCVGTALISMYCKCGSVGDAHQVFEKMTRRDVISWNAMISGLAQQGHCPEAFEVFKQMQQEGIKPNKVTFISILNACASPAALNQGRQLHADIIKSGFESFVEVGNALVTMYGKCGSLVDARQVFSKMPELDVVSWSAVLAGLAQHGQSREALEVFWLMHREGVNPDNVTFISIITACASLAALDEGKRVHAYIIQSGIESDVWVGNALVDMYAKCGSVWDARQVFDKILERDVVSWNVMIVGYAQHGCGKEALQLFQEMQQQGVKPDEVTFIGVLSACSHMGLVDEGHHQFHSMTVDHGIRPSEQHYGCMVDLLGRAGHLDEAAVFIKNIPYEPSAAVWGPLLGACKIHGNVELAERAAVSALKSEPQNAAASALF